MSKGLFRQPIISLRSEGVVGTAEEPIINPHNLKIIGWWCRGGGGQQVLLADGVREVMPDGLAVDDESALATPNELVRHRDVLDIRFRLLEKPVRTKRQKLGKVSDFAYDESMFIKKLYVSRSITKIFSSEDTLIIDRDQVLEVTDKHILVEDAEITAGAEEKVPAGAPVTP